MIKSFENLDRVSTCCELAYEDEVQVRKSPGRRRGNMWPAGVLAKRWEISDSGGKREAKGTAIDCTSRAVPDLTADMVSLAS